MEKSANGAKTVLITGGTSGFGLELARELLNRNCIVVVTGRKPPDLQTNEHRFSFFRVDFSSLCETSEVIRKICKYYTFDIVINNAGVLSPPDLIITTDKLEYSFQVNFLAHLLINEMIIRNTEKEQPLTIVTITSPVYRIAGRDLIPNPSGEEYKPLKAYSRSKLYLALMCNWLPAVTKYPNLTCFGFNPGIFRSGIYRMQKPWFRFLYKIGAPLMRHPKMIAKRLADILGNGSPVKGSIYSLKKIPEPVPTYDRTMTELFWKDCYQNLKEYLSEGM